MLLSKRILKKGLSIAAAMLIACSTLTTSVYAGKKDNVVDYDRYLFDSTIVHTIEITISDEDWSDLLANPLQKTKYCVSVDIDGEHLDNVSMATKGNSSLYAVSISGSQRFSFKLNFGYYEKGQRYHGAKKLNLSNIYTDATYMKDYISYEIFRQIGVESPLCSYAQIYINGELYGLYLAVEEVDGAFVDRAFDGEGEIYKPNSDQEMGALLEEFDLDEGDSDSDSSGDSAADAAEHEAPDANDAAVISEATDDTVTAVAADDTSVDDENGVSEGWLSNTEEADGDSAGFANEAKGGEDLAYIDDELSSYSNIFDKAETKVTEEDEERVVAALRNLSEGSIYEGLDADEVARYFAAHNFVMNYDSYTGFSLHNYYLYENDGLLSMLPWDYNQAFGSFSVGSSNGSSTETINFGIDSPLNGTTESARPMWAWIVSDEEYTELYHSVFNELITNYFESGDFEAEMQRVYELIRPYVENDPSAFYTVDEFDTAFDTLLNFCLLRAESIRKQLNGELSTITSEQKEEDRVDGSNLDVSLTQGQKSTGGDSDGESADSAGSSGDEKT